MGFPALLGAGGLGGLLAKLNTAATIAYLFQVGSEVVNFFETYLFFLILCISFWVTFPFLYEQNNNTENIDCIHHILHIR